jgi:Ca2+-binding EF-hand superfamily protein
MTIKMLAVATALATIIAAPAFAQVPGGGGGGGMRMTPEERAAAFDKGDANKDGKLDKVEFKATIPAEMAANVDDARLGMMFDRRDTDKDGNLSKAEFTAPMQRPQ